MNSLPVSQNFGLSFSFVFRHFFLLAFNSFCFFLLCLAVLLLCESLCRRLPKKSGRSPHLLSSSLLWSQGVEIPLMISNVSHCHSVFWRRTDGQDFGLQSLSGVLAELRQSTVKLWLRGSFMIEQEPPPFPTHQFQE